MTVAPNVVVVAGPNGSGKSTAAPILLRDYLGLTAFVNADTIAQGLSGFDAEGVAFRAGRIMLGRLRELAGEREDFAFETTLASQSFGPWLRDLQRDRGYRVHVIFLWLPSPEMAIARVAARVQQGGHPVDEKTIRRRYERGLRNLFRIYMGIADEWMLLDNSEQQGQELIASQVRPEGAQIEAPQIWRSTREKYA